MTRRWTLLAGAIALSLAAPQAAFATPAAAPPPRRLPTPAAAALRDLKADATVRRRASRVTRAATWRFVQLDRRRRDAGQRRLDAQRRRRRSSSTDYGDAFGIDGATSKAVVTQTLDSVDRRFGGPRRADRRRRPRLRRPGRDEPRPRPGRRLDRVGHHRRHPGAGAGRQRGHGRASPRSAAAARAHGHAPAADASRPWPPALRPRARARRGPGGRPPGLAVRGDQRLRRPRDRAGRHRPRRGRAALQRRPRAQPHGSATTNDVAPSSRQPDVPICSTPARSEGGPASGVADVNDAYDNLGETSDAYDELDGHRPHRHDRRHRSTAPEDGCSPPCAGATPTTHVPLRQRLLGRHPDGVRRRLRRRRTTSSVTSSPTATSSTPPTCSRSTRAARSTSRSPTPSARSSTTATPPRPDDDSGVDHRRGPARRRAAAQHEGPDALRPARHR